ncbi:sedoheptulose 7-phosphate cyclase [Cryobacterium sp. SO2]|uniref:sedoheptulose 7-phosphate cyclase n=1 Tax=Cryobacterium sp. SO2 TaxID=1897060 RepID=UPI00223DB323|nr:sedoheptulose 7-phosphate cyclase [Cryobacterium sp. SO2]WEO77314.1 sedoheptulose 7-phosphate cyclase [Cryobacterium sp. SO2]
MSIHSAVVDQVTAGSRQSATFDLTVAAQRETRYRIVETPAAFALDSPLTEALHSARGTTLIVVDDAVWATSRRKIQEYLDVVTVAHRVLVLPGGESNKTLEHVLRVVEEMDECVTPRRSSPIVAIGGGVVCDVVGFAASVYRRGVPYIRVPTTLLAQVDVSVAIKTGVNRGGYRNRLGAFWPAKLTVLDRHFLATQSVVEISHGLGEIFKLAVIKSPELFGQLEQLPAGWSPAWIATDELSAQFSRLAVAEMAEDLGTNLWEDDLARCVDFGHSFSPLIEMRNGQHHGHAVALDGLLSSCLAAERGLIDGETLERIVAVMRRCALPTSHPDYADVDLLWESFRETIAHRDGHQHLPLPTAIGRCTFIEDLSRDELPGAVRLMRRVTENRR